MRVSMPYRDLFAEEVRYHRFRRLDNGTNFVGAERELKEALAALNQDQLKGALLQDGIH